MEEINTHSSRESVTSQRTSQSTAVDSSTPPSPRDKLGGHGERRASSDTTEPKLQSARTEHGPVVESYGQHDPKTFDRYGWPHLAQVMSQVPEFAAFPRFRELNIKNLLYYQAEIELLRQKIEKEEEEQTLDVTCYINIVKDGDMRQILNPTTVVSDETLMDTDDALLQLSKVSALSDPEEYNMRSLRNWISDDSKGGGQIKNEEGLVETYGDREDLEHTSSFRTVLSALIWAKPPPKGTFDLVVTQPKAKIDGLTKWIVYYLCPYWFSIGGRLPAKADEEEQCAGVRHEKHDQANNTVERISEGAALRLTTNFSTILACLIPVVAIVVLKQLSHTRDLLLCITGFAVFFAAGLIFVTRGTSSKTEIFAATAAFSAVMVVFISQPVIQVAPGSEISMQG